ncbi:Uma2 family endonuclease [Alloacidobacterium sp.]|uniref:Uma2 family endonuclease n=1 Tax=Alloacidobacterium sp. TaxID=2951999 RepID=UPI002D75807E|nr:Uma2 family endonuclease [Alloacidobacterium sp.]HYK36507.1 Uma2 family endonuclease [Alloacidobacterium sp.]
MATSVQVAIETYLKTSYHPDRDYVDGEIEERNLGEFDHATIQMAVLAWFYARRNDWNIHVLPEQRVRVSGMRVRIPDVCLVSRDLPVEQVITHPPLVVVEILSPEDRVRRYNDRLEDYRAMGVKNIWILDPATQTGFDWIAGWHGVVRFGAAGTPVFLDVREIFDSLQK